MSMSQSSRARLSLALAALAGLLVAGCIAPSGSPQSAAVTDATRVAAIRAAQALERATVQQGDFFIAQHQQQCAGLGAAVPAPDSACRLATDSLTAWHATYAPHVLTALLAAKEAMGPGASPARLQTRLDALAAASHEATQWAVQQGWVATP